MVQGIKTRQNQRCEKWAQKAEPWLQNWRSSPVLTETVTVIPLELTIDKPISIDFLLCMWMSTHKWTEASTHTASLSAARAGLYFPLLSCSSLFSLWSCLRRNSFSVVKDCSTHPDFISALCSLLYLWTENQIYLPLLLFNSVIRLHWFARHLRL